MKTWSEIADMYMDAAKAFIRAKQFECAKDPVKWQAAIDEGNKRMAAADKEAKEREA